MKKELGEESELEKQLEENRRKRQADANATDTDTAGENGGSYTKSSTKTKPKKLTAEELKKLCANLPCINHQPKWNPGVTCSKKNCWYNHDLEFESEEAYLKKKAYIEGVKAKRDAKKVTDTESEANSEASRISTGSRYKGRKPPAPGS